MVKVKVEVILTIRFSLALHSTTQMTSSGDFSVEGIRFHSTSSKTLLRTFFGIEEPQWKQKVRHRVFFSTFSGFPSFAGRCASLIQDLPPSAH